MHRSRCHNSQSCNSMLASSIQEGMTHPALTSLAQLWGCRCVQSTLTGAHCILVPVLGGTCWPSAPFLLSLVLLSAPHASFVPRSCGTTELPGVLWVTWSFMGKCAGEHEHGSMQLQIRFHRPGCTITIASTRNSQPDASHTPS